MRNKTERGRTVDLNKHGKLIYTGVDRELAVAARWLGQDYIVTRAVYLRPWRDWPEQGEDLSRFRAEWRQGSRFMATGALRDIGFDFGFSPRQQWLPKLKPYLESVGVVRIFPPRGKKFEEDSLLHWAHHVRDGIYDVWAGCKFDKNGKAIWLGQDEDDNNAEGFVPCQYSQIKADGNGIAMVYRFKPEFVAALPYLLPGEPKRLM